MKNDNSQRYFKVMHAAGKASFVTLRSTDNLVIEICHTLGMIILLNKVKGE